jgi:hypothetical protein
MGTFKLTSAWKKGIPVALKTPWTCVTLSIHRSLGFYLKNPVTESIVLQARHVLSHALPKSCPPRISRSGTLVPLEFLTPWVQYLSPLPKPSPQEANTTCCHTHVMKISKPCSHLLVSSSLCPFRLSQLSPHTDVCRHSAADLAPCPPPCHMFPYSRLGTIPYPWIRRASSPNINTTKTPFPTLLPSALTMLFTQGLNSVSPPAQKQCTAGSRWPRGRQRM